MAAVDYPQACRRAIDLSRKSATFSGALSGKSTRVVMSWSIRSVRRYRTMGAEIALVAARGVYDASVGPLAEEGRPPAVRFFEAMSREEGRFCALLFGEFSTAWAQGGCGQQQQKERSRCRISGGWPAAFPTLHDDITSGRADPPSPRTTAPSQDQLEYWELPRLLPTIWVSMTDPARSALTSHLCPSPLRG